MKKSTIISGILMAGSLAVTALSDYKAKEDTREMVSEEVSKQLAMLGQNNEEES